MRYTQSFCLVDISVSPGKQLARIARCSALPTAGRKCKRVENAVKLPPWVDDKKWKCAVRHYQFRQRVT